jgi:excisionase family DNA binding protein
MSEVTYAIPNALCFTIEGTTLATGLPRTTIYELIGSGKLDARKVGRRTIITGESLRQYLEALPPANIRASKIVKVA